MSNHEYIHKQPRVHAEKVVGGVIDKLREAVAEKRPDAYWISLWFNHVVKNPSKIKPFADAGKSED